MDLELSQTIKRIYSLRKKEKKKAKTCCRWFQMISIYYISKQQLVWNLLQQSPKIFPWGPNWTSVYISSRVRNLASLNKKTGSSCSNSAVKFTIWKHFSVKIKSWSASVSIYRLFYVNYVQLTSKMSRCCPLFNRVLQTATRRRRFVTLPGLPEFCSNMRHKQIWCTCIKQYCVASS